MVLPVDVSMRKLEMPESARNSSQTFGSNQSAESIAVRGPRAAKSSGGSRHRGCAGAEQAGSAPNMPGWFHPGPLRKGWCGRRELNPHGLAACGFSYHFGFHRPANGGFVVWTIPSPFPV